MRRSGVLLSMTLLILVQGCARWRQVPLAPGTSPALATELPVRVTLRNGGAIVLDHPLVEGDSLIGDVGARHERFAITRSDVVRLDECRINTGKSVAAGAPAIVEITTSASGTEAPPGKITGIAWVLVFADRCSTASAPSTAGIITRIVSTTCQWGTGASSHESSHWVTRAGIRARRLEHLRGQNTFQ